MNDNINILIADGAETIAGMLTVKLQAMRKTFRIVRVDSALSLALELRRLPWDAVLCAADALEPDLELVQYMARQVSADLPIIVLADVVGDFDYRKYCERGARDVVPRDEIMHLLEAVDREIGVFRARTELERLLKQSRANARVLAVNLSGFVYAALAGDIESRYAADRLLAALSRDDAIDELENGILLRFLPGAHREMFKSRLDGLAGAVDFPDEPATPDGEPDSDTRHPLRRVIEELPAWINCRPPPPAWFENLKKRIIGGPQSAADDGAPHATPIV